MIVKLVLLYNLLFRPIAVFKKMNFYFMKTANIPVYGNIGFYGNIALFVFEINYTLRYLEYICSVSSPLICQGFSLRSCS